jgi:hypothetical protein
VQGVNPKSGGSWRLRTAVAIAAMVLGASSAAAQTDEIQVYTGEVADPGELALTFHNNYVVSGRTEPGFPGGIVPNHSWNGVPELALGVTRWLELGLYLPVYSISPADGLQLDGAKLRALFALPHAEERRAYVGVNFELSWNAPHWDPSHVTGEVRFIVGGRIGDVELALNPILDTAFDGTGALELAPATRLAYHVSHRWTVALEEYAAMGPLRELEPLSKQGHSLFAVLDWEAGWADLELGLGFGLTDAADDLVVKLIVSPEF